VCLAIPAQHSNGETLTTMHTPAIPASRTLFTFIALLGFLLFITGCEKAATPGQSRELAVKGLYSASLSSDGSQGIIGSITHGGSRWDLQADERLFDWNHAQGENTQIIASSFSPDKRYAITADTQTLVLWDNTTGGPVTFWTSPGEVTSVALTPNGNYALLGMIDHTAVLFDVKRGGIQRVFRHENRLRSVALSENGRLAITGSEDRSARLWDTQIGKLLHHWRHDDEVRLVAIAPKGDRAFSVSKYDKAVVWDTSSGEMVGLLPLRSAALQRGLTFTSAAFSSDSSMLLTGNSDRLVQLWDASTLQELARWKLPKRDPWKPTGAAVLAVSFSEEPFTYHAIASNGFAHQLHR
jgi:WD40 repeat protein